MPHLLRSPRLALVLLLALAAAALRAQTPPPPVFTSLAPIAFNASGPVLREHAQPQLPFTVAGPRGVLVGQQDGSLEAWALPVKILSHLRITANIQGYTVPIDVNEQAAEIEVRPDRTVLTYSHIGFTVRQIMFSPPDAPAGTGPIVLFEFDCLHPTEFTLSFTPEMRWMWPERNDGEPSLEWVYPNRQEEDAPGGYYVLHTDYPNFSAAVAMPGAEPGILAPYQERPHFYPAQLKIRIDPARDRGRLFPLLMAYGSTVATANPLALGETLAGLNAQIPALYKAEDDYWQNFLAHATSISTPNKDLDEAFQWAEISIEQLKTLSQSGETALVAGYYESGDSARPGFGWFFGRDALYTLYAVNGFGDFQLSRDELEFLIHRQRADGKIMHEYSQTAAASNWQQFPYEYAAADSTPLFLLAALDYVRASGDTAFLTAHRKAIEKAWAFETDPAHDTDHDGIYDNSQGTGWVESWPPGMPHQEIYLALLDQQASAAMAQIFSILHDASGAESAKHRATTIATTINREYYDAGKGCYAFSYNGKGKVDQTTTVYPALDWWSGKPILDHPAACLQQFAYASLDTDWGLRDVANTEPLYNGMSYHQGSVWPLFTGWAALAEYRGGQPLAGYRMLMQNANLTRAQDLGADTELLSGDFFVPFGRSTSHQLWSSAMVVTPSLRGLFGISINAQTKTITVKPRLPVTWDTSIVRNIPIGQQSVDLLFHQSHGVTSVGFASHEHAGIHLRSTSPNAKLSADGEIIIPRQPVEVAPVLEETYLGDRTHFARVIDQQYSDHKLTLTIEGRAGTESYLQIVTTSVNHQLHAENASLAGSNTRHGMDAAAATSILRTHFPPGTGWKTVTVTLTW